MVLFKVVSLKQQVDEKMEELKVSDAISSIMEVLKKCNKYIDDTTPWSLAKEEDKKGRLGTVLYNLLESIRVCTVLLQAFIPTTAEKIFKQLNTKETSFDSIQDFEGIKVGDKLGTPEILFQRIEEKK